MVALDAQSPASPPRQNVRGLERVLSIGGGLLFAALGATRRDSRGDRQLGVASLLLLRGLSGHCSVKSAIDDPLEEIRYLRARIQRAQELLLLAEQVAQRNRRPVPPPAAREEAVASVVTPATPSHASGL